MVTHPRCICIPGFVRKHLNVVKSLVTIVILLLVMSPFFGSPIFIGDPGSESMNTAGLDIDKIDSKSSTGTLITEPDPRLPAKDPLMLPPLPQPPAPVSTSTTSQHPTPPPGSRATDPYDLTDAREWLTIDLEITFEHPIWLSIDAKFSVREILLGSPYDQITADEIRKLYEIEAKTSSTNPPILAALLQRINEMFMEIVNETFSSELQIFYDPQRDISSFLYPLDENKYDPPVIVDQECRIKLNASAFFSSSELEKYNIQSLSDLLDGSLKMGSKVTMDLRLVARAGYKMIYEFIAPKYTATSDKYYDQLLISHILNEAPSSSKERVRFSLDNTAGVVSTYRLIKNLVLRNREPNQQTKEAISFKFELDMPSFDAVTIGNSTIQINSLSLSDSQHDLPSNITDNLIFSTDGLRLYYNNGIIDLSDIESALSSEFSRLENQFTRVFNDTTRVSFSATWELSTITSMEPLYFLSNTDSLLRMGAERPILGQLHCEQVVSANLFDNVSSDAVIGLLNAGVIAKLDLSISSQYSYTYNLSIPSGLIFRGQKSDFQSPTGGFGYTLTRAESTDLILTSEDPVKYSSSMANISVKIDFHKLEILGLSEYLAYVRINADGQLHYIEIEQNSKFARALPKGMTIGYYNSDALRLAYTAGLLDLEEIQESMYSIIKENISQMLKEQLKMTVTFNPEMLEFDGDIDHMDDLVPISFKIRASGKMKITEERLVRMGGFVTKKLKLPLQGVKYWNVTYKLILPEHVKILGSPKVENNSVDYSGPFIETTSSGRDELRLTIYGDPLEGYDSDALEVNMEVDIDITLWFFLSQIMIPIILFIILCIVIVALKVYRHYKETRLDKLLREPELMVEEEDTTSGISGRSIKKPSKQMYIKERRRKDINELEFDSETDYKEQLREIMPRQVMKDKGISRRSTSKQQIWKKRRGKGRSDHKRGPSRGPPYF